MAKREEIIITGKVARELSERGITVGDLKKLTKRMNLKIKKLNIKRRI